MTLSVPVKCPQTTAALFTVMSGDGVAGVVNHFNGLNDRTSGSHCSGTGSSGVGCFDSTSPVVLSVLGATPHFPPGGSFWTRPCDKRVAATSSTTVRRERGRLPKRHTNRALTKPSLENATRRAGKHDVGLVGWQESRRMGTLS
jgi:hypothetical protein